MIVVGESWMYKIKVRQSCRIPYFGLENPVYRHAFYVRGIPYEPSIETHRRIIRNHPLFRQLQREYDIIGWRGQRVFNMRGGFGEHVKIGEVD